LEMRRALIEAAAHDSADHYVQEATKQLQGKTLTAQGLGLVTQGQTSLSEVMRMSNRHPL
jgi:type II secretory ATPase GspE/PulE/Tfp pilus assembly ATPase PilB-like protein